MTPKILTVGAAYMDMLMRLPRHPVRGEALLAEGGGTTLLPDGRGANCAAALAKLGARAVLCCRLGEDIHGQRLHATYQQMGIDTTPMIADGRTPTGLSVVMVDDTGDTRTVIYPGANLNLTPDNLRAAFDTAPDAVCLQMDLPEETVLAAAHLAEERHLPIFLDATPARAEFPLSELPELEVFCLNEQETQVYTGIRPSGSDSCLKAALELAKLVKARFYVIKLSDRGAFLFDGRHFNVVGSYTVKVMDTAGVGDAFLAGMTLEYMRTRGDMTAACKYGNTAGAITVMRPGTFTAFPTGEEIAAFIARNGVR